MNDQLPALRRTRIVERLMEHGTLSVAELARLVEVSPITVRRDLNSLAAQGVVRRVHGGASISDEARTIETDHPTHTIGLLLPANDYHWPDVVQGARVAAEGLRVRLVIQPMSHPLAEGIRARTQPLLESGVDGLVMAHWIGDPSTKDEFERLRELGVPVVLIEREASYRSLEPVESVRTDHLIGTKLAARHLADLGHRKVGLVLVEESPHSTVIDSTWREAAAAMGISADDAVTVARGSVDSFHRVREAVGSARATGTTAFVAHADPEAIALTQAAASLGVSIPRDMSVIAYDDEIAGFATPALTALRAPRHSLGRAAIELLVGRLQEPARPTHRVVISPKLTVRSSTAPAKTH